MKKPNYAWKNIEKRNFLFFVLTPVAAVLLTWLHIELEGFNPWLIPWAIGFYVLTTISTTAGYHRLFSHRAYKANNLVKALFLFFGGGAFQESALKWGTDHRRHHTKVDSDEDPYTISKGFFYAHIGWIFLKDESKHTGKFAKDLENDPLVKWQFDHYLAVAITAGFIVPMLIGFALGSPIGGLAIIGFVKTVLQHHMTFLINSACHMWGRQPYTDTNTAKDSITMAVATMGEGYHNFHHYFQADYRNGIRWYHWDPTKWLINTFYSLGWAWDLRITPDSEILKAKMEMDQKRLALKLEKKTHTKIDLSKFELPKFEMPQFDMSKFEMMKFDGPKLQALKEQVQTAQKNFQELKKQYALAKEQVGKDSKKKLEEIKANIRLAKIEFKAAYAQWHLYLDTMGQLA